MPARCIITVLDGARAGVSQTFDLRETPKIIIGTDPGCEVALPAEQHPGVARRHAALRWDAEAGTLTLVDSSVEGSSVEGQRVMKQSLRQESTITLGRDRVKLRVVWKVEVATRSTLPGAALRAEDISDASVAPTGPVERRSAMWSTILIVGVVVLGASAWSWQQLSTSKARAAEVESSIEKRLGDAKRDFERRMSGEVALIQQQIVAAKRETQSGLVDVDAAAAMAQARAAQAEKKAASVRSDAEAFSELARRCEHSVALVTGAGGSATAFAIGPQLFATNSHVSQPVTEALSKGDACWLVMNKSGGKRLRIIRTTVHPQYDRNQRRVGIGYDVGLLFTDTPTTEWLTIAADEALAQLDAGHPVCYIGFPSEGLSGGNLDEDDPVATMKTGILTAVSAWDLRDAGAQQNLLLRHDMGSAGGASGSPILDREGRVIGVHNAGNYFFLKDAPRIPNAANINFAQRIDCLKDIWPDYPK